MSVYLKIKGLSIAQEQRIIRRIERKRRDFLRKVDPDHQGAAVAFSERQRLYKHRMELRKIARSAHIAYTFIRTRGEVPFHKIEQKSYTQPDWAEVSRLVDKYGVIDPANDDIRIVQQVFARWIDEAGIELQAVEKNGKRALDDINWKPAPGRKKRTRPSDECEIKF